MQAPEQTPERSAQSLPVFVQISEKIMRDIASGRLLVGDKLPPVRELAQTHGVAVATLLKALKRLEDRGVIATIQGSGSYVSASDDTRGVYSFFRLELLAGGGLPRAKILSLDYLQKPADFPKFGTSSHGHRFRRLRYLDDQLAALEEIWLDGDVMGQTDSAQVSESLYKFYQDHLGLWITRIEDRINTAPVPDWSVPAFAPAIGQVTPFVSRLADDQHGRCIEYSRNWYDPQIANYVTRIR